MRLGRGQKGKRQSGQTFSHARTVRKRQRFVPFEEYRRIDDFTKDQLRAIVARLREAHKEDADILDLFRGEVCYSKVIIQHFTHCDALLALPLFADNGFTPAPPPVSSSVALRFVGGKARRTQIGVALFRDGRSASDTGESSLASATRARPEDSERQEARGKNPLTESLRCTVQYRTGTPDGP